MENDDYWKDMIDDLLVVLIKTYGSIAIVLAIIGVVLKLLGYL